MAKKKASGLKAAHKSTRTIYSGVRMAEATLVDDDVVKKTGFMVDVVSNRKTLRIQVEASGSTTKTEDVMKVSNKTC